MVLVVGILVTGGEFFKIRRRTSERALQFYEYWKWAAGEPAIRGTEPKNRIRNSSTLIESASFRMKFYWPLAS
jgi:hypothetical protein